MGLNGADGVTGRKAWGPEKSLESWILKIPTWGKRRQGHFEMSCKIGNGMVLASEMFVSLESASMSEGAWHLFSLLSFLPKSQVWGVELCTGLGRCHGTASYSRFFKTF